MPRRTHCAEVPGLLPAAAQLGHLGHSSGSARRARSARGVPRPDARARPGSACSARLGRGSASAGGVPRPRITRVRHSRTRSNTIPPNGARRPAMARTTPTHPEPEALGTGAPEVARHGTAVPRAPNTRHPATAQSLSAASRPGPGQSPPDRRRTSGSGPHSGRTVRTPSARVRECACRVPVTGAVQGPSRVRPGCRPGYKYRSDLHCPGCPG